MTDQELRQMLLRLDLDKMPKTKVEYYQTLKRVIAESKKQDTWKAPSQIGSLIGD